VALRRERLQLREDEPHPVAALAAGGELARTCGIDAALGVDEALQVEGDRSSRAGRRAAASAEKEERPRSAASLQASTIFSQRRGRASGHAGRGAPGEQHIGGICRRRRRP